MLLPSRCQKEILASSLSVSSAHLRPVPPLISSSVVLLRHRHQSAFAPRWRLAATGDAPDGLGVSQNRTTSWLFPLSSLTVLWLWLLAVPAPCFCSTSSCSSWPPRAIRAVALPDSAYQIRGTHDRGGNAGHPLISSVYIYHHLIIDDTGSAVRTLKIVALRLPSDLDSRSRKIPPANPFVPGPRILSHPTFTPDSANPDSRLRHKSGIHGIDLFPVSIANYYAASTSKHNYAVLKCMYTGLDSTARVLFYPKSQVPAPRPLHSSVPLRSLSHASFVHHQSLARASQACHPPRSKFISYLQLSWSPLQTAFSTTPSRT